MAKYRIKTETTGPLSEHVGFTMSVRKRFLILVYVAAFPKLISKKKVPATRKIGPESDTSACRSSVIGSPTQLTRNQSEQDAPVGRHRTLLLARFVIIKSPPVTVTFQRRRIEHACSRQLTTMLVGHSSVPNGAWMTCRN